MTGSVALLVNPTAGKGRAGRIAGSVAARLKAGGIDVETVAGRDGDEALDLARKAVHNEAPALIALGGDGMVHIALQAVAGTAVPLGIVPAGTGNDFAATLGLPKDPLAAAAVIAAQLKAESPGRSVDLGRAGELWYGAVLGAGFDSRVNDRANRLSWPRGRLRYDLAILAELRVFRPLPFRITLDGELLETEAMLVAVGNGRSYGAGMRITPDASVTDGLLDVAVIGRLSKPEFLKTFPRVYRGTHVSHPAVTVRRARVVQLESPGVNAYADGEFAAPLPITCESVPGALRVLAP